MQSEIQDVKVEIRRRLNVNKDPVFKIESKNPIIRPMGLAASNRQLQRVLSVASDLQQQLNKVDEDIEKINGIIKSQPKNTSPKQVGLVKSTYLRKILFLS